MVLGNVVETEELTELYNCFPPPNVSMHLHKRVQTEACILSTIQNVLLLHFACCLLIDRLNNSPPLLDRKMRMTIKLRKRRMKMRRMIMKSRTRMKTTMTVKSRKRRMTTKSRRRRMKTMTMKLRRRMKTMRMRSRRRRRRMKKLFIL